MFLTPTQLFDLLIDDPHSLASMLPAREVWERSNARCISCGVGVAASEDRHSRKGFVVHASTFWVDAPDELPMNDAAALVLLCGLCMRSLAAHPDSSSATTLLENKRQRESGERSLGDTARALRAALHARARAQADEVAAVWIAWIQPSFLGHAVLGGCAVQSLSSPDPRVRHFLAMATAPEAEIAPVETSSDPVLPLLRTMDLLSGFEPGYLAKHGRWAVADGIRYRVDVEVDQLTAVISVSNPRDDAMRRLEHELHRAGTGYAELANDERAVAYVREWKNYLRRS